MTKLTINAPRKRETKDTLVSFFDVVIYIIENGYHRQRNEDGTANFEYIDADLSMDQHNGKVVLPDNHNVIEAAYGFIQGSETCQSPVAATLLYTEAA